MKQMGLDSVCSWKIVAACFIIKFISIGLVEVSGILMIASMARYETTREEASLPFTLLYTIRNGIGPLIAHLGMVIDIRLVTLIGCIVTFLSVAACFFVESISFLTVTFGVFFGLGFALDTLLINVILMEHFEQHLSKAAGISSSGSQLGTTFFSIVIETLIDTFGLSGAFLVASGIAMNAIPAALVIIFNKPRSNIPNEAVDNTHSSNNKTENNLDIFTIEKYKRIRGSVELTEIDNSILVNKNIELSKSNELSEIQIKTFYKCDKSFNSNECLSNANREIDYHTKKYDTDIHAELSYNSVLNILVNDCNKQTTVDLLTFRRISYTFDKDTLNDNLKKTFNRQSVKAIQDKNNELQNSKPVLIQLFSEPVFISLLISGGIYYYTTPAVLTVIVDYAIDIGIEPPTARYFLTWAAVSELCGSFFLGWIPDSGLISANGFAALCFVSECVALLIFVWCKHFIFLAFVTAIFQLSQAGLTLIYPAIVKNTLDKTLQSSAIASMFILASPLALTISPLIGYFRDQRGNYAGIFYILSAAAFIGFSAHMYITKLERNKRDIKNTTE